MNSNVDNSGSLVEDDLDTNSVVGNKFSQLQQDYSTIKASPYLRTRVLAEIESMPTKRPWTRLGITSFVLTVLIAVVIVLPTEFEYSEQQFSAQSSMSGFLSASNYIPETPPLTLPGLSQLSGIPTQSRTPNYTVLSTKFSNKAESKSGQSDVKINGQPPIQRIL